MTDQPQTDKKTILVADDDVDFLMQLQLHLTAMGFDVVTAESQAQAEDALGRMRPDLAVLDLMMEHQDAGFALCYQIKSIDASIPVILCTAVTSETGLRFDDAGQGQQEWIKADAVLAKPVRLEQLQHEVNRLLGRT